MQWRVLKIIISNYENVLVLEDQNRQMFDASIMNNYNSFNNAKHQTFCMTVVQFFTKNLISCSQCLLVVTD